MERKVFMNKLKAKFEKDEIPSQDLFLERFNFIFLCVNSKWKASFLLLSLVLLWPKLFLYLGIVGKKKIKVGRGKQKIVLKGELNHITIFKSLFE